MPKELSANSPSFFEKVANSTISIATDLDVESDTLLVIFGGLRGGLGVPLFEFKRTVSKLEMPFKTPFVRDLHQAWYQKGLADITSNVDETRDYLHRVFDAQKPNRIVMLGNSVGGYAAILFACLAGADEVLAISPQTYLGLV